MTADSEVEKFRHAARAGNPAAQFNLGLWLMRQPNMPPFPDEAMSWFERAAAAGFAPAQTMLGRRYLGVEGEGRDIDQAARWFRKAAGQAFPEAVYQLGELAVAAGDSPANYEQARRWLEEAVRLAHPLACCQLAYLHDEGLGGSADPVRALELYQQAARHGVPRAWNQLGRCLATGNGFEADAAAALAAYRRAAALDYPGALRVAERLESDMPGREVDAASQLSDDAVSRQPIRAGNCRGRPACSPEVLSESPRIALLRNLFTETECQHLIAMSRPHLEPSRVVSEQGTNVSDSMRTSWEMRFAPESADMLVRIYERRLAGISNTRVRQGEPLLILRYHPGQEYRTHVDYFDPRLAGQKRVIDQAGQRILTMLTYLCEVEEGGGTEFPELGITVAPKTGSTLAFYNVLPDGQVDPRSKHAGLPVVAGVKWLATRWIRDRDWV